MSAVGLTKAMRRALERLNSAQFSSNRMFDRAIAAGLAFEDVEHNDFGLTPRGHAALAAPKMTQTELDWMERIESGAEGCPSSMYMRLFNNGWIEPTTNGLTGLTPAGRIALNNVRAAIGSPEWKENMS